METNGSLDMFDINCRLIPGVKCAFRPLKIAKFMSSNFIHPAGICHYHHVFYFPVPTQSFRTIVIGINIFKLFGAEILPGS